MTPAEHAAVAEAIAALEPLEKAIAEARTNGHLAIRFVGDEYYGVVEKALASLRAIAPAPAETLRSSRDAFEQWYFESEGLDASTYQSWVARRDDGDYRSPSVQSLWEAWTGCLARCGAIAPAPADQSDAGRDGVIKECAAKAEENKLYWAAKVDPLNFSDASNAVWRAKSAACFQVEMDLRALASAPSEVEEDATSPELMERHLEYARESAKAQLASAPAEAPKPPERQPQ